MIEDVTSGNVLIKGIDADKAAFKALDKPSSISMSLPEKFSVPAEPEYAIMTFQFNPKSEPVKVLGVAIYDQTDGETKGRQKVVSANSIARKYFMSAPAELGKTAGIPQQSIVDVFDNLPVSELKPSEKVAMIAGKTFKSVGESQCWGGVWEEGKLVSYKEQTRNFFTVDNTVNVE